MRAKNGCITLEGNILAHETSNVLSSVRSVSGVQDIENRLRVHEDAGNLSALQGGNARARQRWDFMQSNWSPTTRLVASAIGGGLVLYGLATIGDGLLTRGNRVTAFRTTSTISPVSVELYGGSS